MIHIMRNVTEIQRCGARPSLYSLQDVDNKFLYELSLAVLIVVKNNLCERINVHTAPAQFSILDSQFSILNSLSAHSVLRVLISASFQFFILMDYLCTQKRTVMEKRRAFPIGRQNLADIITGGLVYVDKPSFIHDLAQTDLRLQIRQDTAEGTGNEWKEAN